MPLGGYRGAKKMKCRKPDLFNERHKLFVATKQNDIAPAEIYFHFVNLHSRKCAQRR